MKIKKPCRLGGHVLFMAVAALLFCAGQGWSSGSEPDPRSRQVYQRLLSKALEKGTTGVIVRLDTGFAPDKKMIHSAIPKQQREIAGLQSALQESLAHHRVSGLKKFRHIPFMAMKVDAAALSALVANPLVAGIEEDIYSPPLLIQSTTITGADAAWSAGLTGQGWTIAVLDTGVDTSHSFLGAKVISEACYSTNNSDEKATSLCPGGQPSQTGAGSAGYCPLSIEGCYHGTHVAGIAAGRGDGISGVAKDASLIAVQIFTKIDDPDACSPSDAPCILTLTSDQLSALEHIYELRTAYNISSVNMSIGAGRYAGHCDSENLSLKAAIDNLSAAGIATIAAAGNEGYIDGITSPACVSSAISVGATTKSDIVAEYSNSASILSLLAPGSDIYSSFPGNRWKAESGTSMAAPHVAGAWAILKRYKPSAAVAEILSVVQTTGLMITDARNSITKPRIRVDAAINSLKVGCSASVSDNLTVFVPLIDLNGLSLWADLRYHPDPGGIFFRVSGYGPVSSPEHFSGCAPSTISPSLVLHIPDIRIGSASYSAELQYAGGPGDILFRVTGFSLNSP
ncbi:MAG: S8 family serine peptidase [Nitrospirae bacterium]|nr:S8 family serine peptidase [Nitrospirota bacterium]